MNLNKLMKQAQEMQAQMAKAQAELEEKTVEVTAVGGKIKVAANGAGEILSIKIDHAIVDPNDVEFLEEAVLSGVQQAIEQGKALAQSEMKKITGGLGMPELQPRSLSSAARWRLRLQRLHFALPRLPYSRNEKPNCANKKTTRATRTVRARKFEMVSPSRLRHVTKLSPPC